METSRGLASQALVSHAMPMEVVMKILRMVEADSRENGVGSCPVNFLLQYRRLSTTFRRAVDALVVSFECDIRAFERCVLLRERLGAGSLRLRVTLSLNSLFRRWPGLTSLNVTSPDTWSPDDLQCVVDLAAIHCHSLRHLSINNLRKWDAANIAQSGSLAFHALASLSSFDSLSLTNFCADRATTSSLSSLPLLADLTIRKSPTPFRGIESLPSLTRLTLDAPPCFDGFEEVLYPLRASPRLTALSLEGIHLQPELPPTLRRLKLGDLSSYVSVAGPALPQLLELDIECASSGKLWQLLASCRELTSLQVRHISLTVPTPPQVLSHLTNLKVLRLEDWQELGPIPSLSELTALDSLYLAGLSNTDMPPIGALQSLRNFTLKDFTFGPDSLDMLSDLTALASLHVDSSLELEDCRALSLLVALTNLELTGLDVRKLPDFGPLQSLKSLRLKDLRLLESVETFDRQDPGLEGGCSVWAELPCLTSLVLHNLSCLRRSALEHSRTLLSLTLGGGQEVPSLTSLTALRNLSLNHSPTLELVADDLQGLVRLSSLSISVCSILRSVRLPPLPLLRLVDIKDCPLLEVVEGLEMLPRFASVTVNKVKLRRSS